MKSSKVLRKLRLKVKDRTVFLSEQGVNDTLCLQSSCIRNKTLFCLSFALCAKNTLALYAIQNTQTLYATIRGKQKKSGLKTNRFALHFSNLRAIKEPSGRTREPTRQIFCVKNKTLFWIRLSQKLCLPAAFYKNYKIGFLLRSVKALPPTFAFLFDLHNLSVRAKKMCLPMFNQNLIRSAADTSISLIYFDDYIYKHHLGLNDSSDYRMYTVRSSNKLFQPRKKHKIIRPLLDFKRESITMVCKDFKMPVYPDQSNRSVQYSRNRIRKQIIPCIKYFINPQVENSLFKMAELLNKEQLFLYSVLRNTSAKVHF